jgi:hypothetical protein
MNFKKLVLVFTASLLLLLGGCASGYKEFYKPAQGATPEAIAAIRVNKAPAIPIIERAQPADSSVVLDAYGKRGYVMVGSSMFNSGKAVSEDEAVSQGKAVGADLVLIFNPKYTGSITSSVPLTTPTSTTTYSTGSATAYGAGGSVTAYGSGSSTTYGSQTTYVPMTVLRSDYGAVFFIKRTRVSLFVWLQTIHQPLMPTFLWVMSSPRLMEFQSLIPLRLVSFSAKDGESKYQFPCFDAGKE